jgi:hypothetical protein
MNNAVRQKFTRDTLMQTRAGGVSSTAEKYVLLPPPIIKTNSANQTLPTNTSVTLLCEVIGQVAFEVQRLQEDPPRLTVLENGVYVEIGQTNKKYCLLVYA